MNNITPMFANNTALQAIRDGGYGSADFDIGVVPLNYLVRGDDGLMERHNSSKSVIYRTDTRGELGIHGHGYKAVAPKHMIDVTRNIIERSGLAINNMREQIRTSHDGARTFVQYTLPEHTYRTSDGDSASLSLLSISSFDGTWPFMISAAAIQSACTNLQVFVGGEVAVYKAKHTQSLDIEHGGRAITKAMDVFHKERDLWLQWIDTSVTDQAAFKFFAEALKCSSALSLIESGVTQGDMVLSDMPRKSSSLEYIWNKYVKVYRKRLGSNYWAVYNAMTDWSSHGGTVRQGTSGNIAAVKHERHQLIRTAIRNNDFMKAA